jgi:hypothetical protein
MKLSELTTNPNLSTDDLLYVVDDAAGTPNSYKTTIADVLGLYDSSNLVPYTGAISAVDLGSNELTCGNIVANGSITIGDYTLPSADGAVDQVLQTDGSGTVSWATVSGGGGITAARVLSYAILMGG